MNACDFQRRMAERLRADEKTREKTLTPARRALRSLRATLTMERKRHQGSIEAAERTYREARDSGVSRETLYWLTLARVRIRNPDAPNDA